MEYLKLHYGNKGFILSLDALVAIIVVFVVINGLAATMQNREELTNLYLSKKGSDIAALIDNNNKTDTLNKTEIMNEVINLSSREYIEMNITTYNANFSGKLTIDFSTGGKPTGFVSSGKRFFLADNDTDIIKFGVIKYKIWQK